MAGLLDLPMEVIAIIIKFVFLDSPIMLPRYYPPKQAERNNGGLILQAHSAADLERMLQYAESRGIPIANIGLGTLGVLELIRASSGLHTDKTPGGIIACHVDVDRDVQDYAVDLKLPILRIDHWTPDYYPILDAYTRPLRPEASLSWDHSAGRILLQETTPAIVRNSSHPIGTLHINPTIYRSAMSRKIAWENITICGSWDETVRLLAADAKVYAFDAARQLQKLCIDHTGTIIMGPHSPNFLFGSLPELQECTIQLRQAWILNFDAIPTDLVASYRSTWGNSADISVCPLEMVITRTYAHLSGSSLGFRELLGILGQIVKEGFLVSFCITPCRMGALGKCNEAWKCGWPTSTRFGLDPFEPGGSWSADHSVYGHIQVKIVSGKHDCFAEVQRTILNPALRVDVVGSTIHVRTLPNRDEGLYGHPTQTIEPNIHTGRPFRHTLIGAHGLPPIAQGAGE